MQCVMQCVMAPFSHVDNPPTNTLPRMVAHFLMPLHTLYISLHTLNWCSTPWCAPAPLCRRLIDEVTKRSHQKPQKHAATAHHKGAHELLYCRLCSDVSIPAWHTTLSDLALAGHVCTTMTNIHDIVHTVL